jgi:transcriptional regulator with XRE-family HTH domain
MPAELYPPDFRVRPIKARTASRFREITTRRTVTVPDRVSPHVKLVFLEMSRRQVTYDQVEAASGVRRPTIKQWRRKNRPSLESLESVLSVLGWAYVPTPSLQVLPPELAGELTALALKLGKSMPETVKALIDIGVEQKLLAMSAEEKRALLAEREARETNRAALRAAHHRRKSNPANDNVKQASVA